MIRATCFGPPPTLLTKLKSTCCNGSVQAGRLTSLLARRAHRIDHSGQGWMVCRVPVAFQSATGDDARSLRPPALLPTKTCPCGAAPPVVVQVQRVMAGAMGDQPGHPVECVTL